MWFVRSGSQRGHTRTVLLNLVESPDAVVQPLEGLLVVRERLHLKQIDCRRDIHTVRQRELTVVRVERLAKQVEHGNDGRR